MSARPRPEADEDHEQDSGSQGVIPPTDWEAEQLLAVAVLEDQGEEAVGGTDRQQFRTIA
jgi:hypothetical protein